MSLVSENSSLNSRIINDLRGCIDPTQLMHSYQHPRKNGRLYGYCDVLRDACKKCFYWRDGIVYVFDGRIWLPFDVDVLRFLVRDALVGASGMGSEVVKSDWVDNERKLFGWAIDGIKEHKLEYSFSLVGFSNGVWDFGDMSNPVHHSFSERMPVTSLLGYKYDPSAGCPVWLNFLKMMLPSQRDVDVLQKFMSLGCCNRSSLGQKVEESLWLIGDGANGKTTIQNVIRMVYGERNVSSISFDALLDRNIDARLRAMGAIEGKVFNMCQEISGTEIEKGGDVFKSLVSGEEQAVRDIGKNIRAARAIPYLIFSMNQMPSNKRMDRAFRRRIAAINFRSSVKREDMDRGLLLKLAGELSGIRNWVIEGWFKLVRDGFSIKSPQTDDGMSAEEVEWCIMNGQTVDIWIEQWAFISPSRHVGHDDEVCLDIRSIDLYNDYKAYCENHLLCEEDNLKQFGLSMHNRLNFESHRKAQGVYYRVYCDKDNKFNVKQ